MFAGQAGMSDLLSAEMEPGKIIRDKRKLRAWSQTRLAQESGVSQPAIRKIESGETKRSKFLPRIAAALNIEMTELDPWIFRDNGKNIADEMNKDTRSPLSHPHATRPRSLQAKTIPGAHVMGEVDLPVFLMVRRGQEPLLIEPYTRIGRPHNLLSILDAHAVLVKGNTMAREYNEGDLAYVDRHKPPRAGDACLFSSLDNEGTVVDLCIKYLTQLPDHDPVHWHVEQTNPPKKSTLKRDQWQLCHTLVGKQTGR